MAQVGNVAFCALMMTACWTLIGFPISTRLLPHRSLWLFAPALGWAVFSVLALAVFLTIGMKKSTVISAMVLAVALAAIALWRQKPIGLRFSPVILLALLGATLLAAGAAAGVMPKFTDEGVTLASPIFDHSKVAMIDEMIRTGVPAKNPFFGETGSPERLSYYYLWHFSAATIALAVGVSGWEADAALTWFTAFASLLVMIGIAIWLSGRASAGAIVIILAATASLRTILEWIAPSSAQSIFGWMSGFGGWLFQVSWAPQHVASAMCVVVACVLITQIQNSRSWALPVLLGVIAAASFECSAWVGGITFAFAAVAIGIFLLCTMPSECRTPFLLRLTLSAFITTGLAMPFLFDQAATTSLRGDGSPIAINAVAVLGDAFPETIRRILDPPAFWLVYLPIEFPAFYVAGLCGLFIVLRDTTFPSEQRKTARSFALLVAASLLVAWLAASAIGNNNDLGWRAVLPAVMLLIPTATIAVLRLNDAANKIPLALILIAVSFGLVEGVRIVNENASIRHNASERELAAAPEMWENVRRHTALHERIANNPLSLVDVTYWPANISWALLANRRSCYASYELAIPFAAVSKHRRAEIDELFVRIFHGHPLPADVEQLSAQYRCDVAVVTPQDGAWTSDPFAESKFYRLMEERSGAWRIYRKTTIALR